MAEIDINQNVADYLIGLAKVKKDDAAWTFPAPGGAISIPLTSEDGKENFILDISRSNIKISKMTYNNRTRSTIVLLRLDIDGPPHRNPDGEEVPSTHLHIYREGHGDKWAYPIPEEFFTNLLDYWVTLEDFFRYCNIVKPPNIGRGLFQ